MIIKSWAWGCGTGMKGATGNMRKDSQRRPAAPGRASWRKRMRMKVGLPGLVAAQVKAPRCEIVLETTTQVPYNWDLDVCG